MKYGAEGLLLCKHLLRYLFFLWQRLSPYNHTPYFPYFLTHFVDSMPICSGWGFVRCPFQCQLRKITRMGHGGVNAAPHH